MIDTKSLPPRPWSIAPLKGKYYGTDVIDANGDDVCRIWVMGDYTPSPRELEQLGGIDPVDYFCDTHFESMASYSIASLIVYEANKVLHVTRGAMQTW